MIFPLKMLIFLFLSFAVTGCTSLSARNDISLSSSNASSIQQALVFQIDEGFGKTLTSKDKQTLMDAEQRALEYGAVGKGILWQGERDNITGTITAYRPFRVGQSNCRRFEHRLLVSTKTSIAKGTACRQGNGVWKLIQ